MCPCSLFTFWGPVTLMCPVIAHNAGHSASSFVEGQRRELIGAPLIRMQRMGEFLKALQKKWQRAEKLEHIPSRPRVQTPAARPERDLLRMHGHTLRSWLSSALR